jgi:hypothetical protein
VGAICGVLAGRMYDKHGVRKLVAVRRRADRSSAPWA